jgi:hypothetical protein
VEGPGVVAGGVRGSDLSRHRAGRPGTSQARTPALLRSGRRRDDGPAARGQAFPPVNELVALGVGRVPGFPIKPKPALTQAKPVLRTGGGSRTLHRSRLTPHAFPFLLRRLFHPLWGDKSCRVGHPPTGSPPSESRRAGRKAGNRSARLSPSGLRGPRNGCSAPAGSAADASQTLAGPAAGWRPCRPA